MGHGFRDHQVSVVAYYDWESAGPDSGSCLHHWSNGIRRLTERWNSEFPRFAELRNHMSEDAYEGWFATVPSSAFLRGEPREAYQRREAELGITPSFNPCGRSGLTFYGTVGQPVDLMKHVIDFREVLRIDSRLSQVDGRGLPSGSVSQAARNARTSSRNSSYSLP